MHLIPAYNKIGGFVGGVWLIFLRAEHLSFWITEAPYAINMLYGSESSILMP